MNILSFTHHQVDPNLYECVCSEHKGRKFVIRLYWGTIDFHSRKKNIFYIKKKYLDLLDGE